MTLKSATEKLVRVGIVGISGYSGYTALKILLKHPHVRVTYVSANNTQGPVGDIWPRLKGETDLTCTKFDPKTAADLCDVIFLAVPHTVSMDITPQLLKAGKQVIDFSGDYRLSSPEEFKKWYGAGHKDTANLGKAVYGLPEILREKIKKAALVSNPGCYPTAAILALAPMTMTKGEEVGAIIIDAKSGVSGAGKKVSAGFIYCEVNENFKAYKVMNHQHTPEINQYLSRVSDRKISVTFVPHLLPVNHGILETIYVTLNRKSSEEKIQALYQRFYKTEPFVRVLGPGQQPELKNVVGTNYCDIGLALSDDGKLLVITSAIDNLYKGAAGQAVQNMNIMCGINEQIGLI
ncbi:MAG: N-acetyl-gamma-glutamyl-phosphate reductase [Candidatus Omnitrophota bacterium]|nr:N-acetyl-gamma-glutamyl-phosphate reductase [Candidatus Omnitrophota bacterium]MDZ4241516.1 N-acetyl-gamma-glutamyl-phosphate reductase [Candidatus Omnitrophota bacterium]